MIVSTTAALTFARLTQAACYDAVLCALGVQYLQEPEMVFAEVCLC